MAGICSRHTGGLSSGPQRVLGVSLLEKPGGDAERGRRKRGRHDHRRDKTWTLLAVPAALLPDVPDIKSRETILQQRRHGLALVSTR